MSRKFILNKGSYLLQNKVKYDKIQTQYVLPIDSHTTNFKSISQSRTEKSPENLL